MTIAAFRVGVLIARIVFVILIATAVASCEPAQEPFDLSSVPDRSRVELQVGEQAIVVEVVNTTDSVRQGLSGRSEIGSDGMLFLMPERAVARFWMKEMLFPLDMIWIDGDSVVGITSDVPIPTAGMTTTSLPVYPSPSRVTSVLEVPAGTAAERGWVTGDRIQAIKLVE